MTKKDLKKHNRNRMVKATRKQNQKKGIHLKHT